VKPSSRYVAPIVNAILGTLCRIDAAELAKVPRKGPLIIAMNHINFLEAPLLYGHLYPRDIAGFAKAETWAVPVVGMLARIWECVPVYRGSQDMGSMRMALEVLARGRMLNVMPEGRRSHDGKLGRGQAGIVAIALRSRVPILPIAQYGGEAFWRNLKRGRRTSVHFRVGEVFMLRDPGPGEGRRMRTEAADEIMRAIAALLPREYRGAYEVPGPAPRHIVTAEGSVGL
jgi:1-acyl-sn-glycerol-3-phosphate acyltransferase